LHDKQAQAIKELEELESEMQKIQKLTGK